MRIIVRGFFTLLLLHAGSILLRAQPPAPPPGNLCDTVAWKLVWHDEFDTLIANTGKETATDKKWFTWQPQWDNAAYNNRGGYYNTAANEGARRGVRVNHYDENISLDSGLCTITMRQHPNTWYGSTRELSSGILTMDLGIYQGRFDIRCRLPRHIGVWAAFWLWSQGFTSPPVTGSEIDIFEYTPAKRRDLNEMSTSLHGWNRGAGADEHYESQKHYRQQDLDDWHLFSLEWDDHFIRFYVDGVLKVTQARWADPKGRELRDCNPKPEVRYRERDDVWPILRSRTPAGNDYPYMSVIVSLDANAAWKKAPDVRKVNGKHVMPDRKLVVDYIRVYQRRPQSVFTVLPDPGGTVH